MPSSPVGLEAASPLQPIYALPQISPPQELVFHHHFVLPLESVKSEWLQSIASQAQALLAQREFHILGNHLFANGKGLVFAGGFLAGPDADGWLVEGLEILDREIQEQFLSDGAHFELSPMYHAILLWDVCDLVNLANRSGLDELHKRAHQWRVVINRGLEWLVSMVHPDGNIPFFNDAAFGIAPTLLDLTAYAETLGCFTNYRETAELSYKHNEASGYVTVRCGNASKALLDVARIGPDYQLGHAHADTLSFELSLFGQRVFVNSGTSQYGQDVERQRQRSTRAHNTVIVNGENSSEVWSGFRVARRARPRNLEIIQNTNKLTVSCEHDGYRRLSCKIIHHRQWDFELGGGYQFVIVLKVNMNRLRHIFTFILMSLWRK